MENGDDDVHGSGGGMCAHHGVEGFGGDVFEVHFGRGFEFLVEFLGLVVGNEVVVFAVG